MKPRHPSVFPAVPDNRERKSDASFAMLLICGAAAVGLCSVTVELLSCLGWPVPHVLSMSIGLFVGVIVGVHAARTFTPSNNQSDG